MTPSKHAFDLIKKYEGLSLKAYPDPASGGDPWTIGYGSTGSGIKKGVVWTLDQAEARLILDVTMFARKIAALVSDKTTQDQFDAFVVFAYNVGVGAFAKSTMLKLHNSGKTKEAADQFARWNKAAGKVMRGLTARRAAEADLYSGK